MKKYIGGPMLISIDTGRLINYIPHREQYERWKARLANEQFEAICEELNDLIKEGEVHTSSWMPGGNWSGTVFEPIYSIACQKNEETSGMFFGIILWEVMMRRPDRWSFGRYEKDGIPIRGLTYFRIR